MCARFCCLNVPDYCLMWTLVISNWQGVLGLWLCTRWFGVRMPFKCSVKTERSYLKRGNLSGLEGNSVFTFLKVFLFKSIVLNSICGIIKILTDA